uniref:Putative 5-3 exoribonuclease 2-like protein n=1 Tax=Rhodnius prolixus TaxID=13249 RepID=A0A4P6D9H2_RHOPR
MKSLIALLASLALATAIDDGQWHPALDGSYLGQWNPWMHGSYSWTPQYIHRLKRDLVTPYGVVLHDDGQWKPALDNSWLGSGKLQWGKGIVGATHPFIAHRLKRDLYANPWMNPYALSLPLDAPHVAAVKQAHLIQQAAEGARNLAGGGIPLALPADTPEVAAGKISHAIAHNQQKAINAGIYNPLII